MTCRVWAMTPPGDERARRGVDAELPVTKSRSPARTAWL